MCVCGGCVWRVIIFVTIGGSGCVGSEECGVVWCSVELRGAEQHACTLYGHTWTAVIL